MALQDIKGDLHHGGQIAEYAFKADSEMEAYELVVQKKSAGDEYLVDLETILRENGVDATFIGR